MNKTNEILYLKSQEIKVSFFNGVLTESEALNLLKDYITAFNLKSKELALKYNQKTKLITAKKYLYSNY